MSEDGVVTVLLYLIGLNFERRVSASAMDRKIAGLAFWFNLTGGRDVTKAFMVQQALKGYKKGKRVCDSRRPVTFPMLHQLIIQVSRVCASSYEASLFKAAFMLAFYEALRVGELVCPFRMAGGSILASDVHCGSSAVALLLRRSQTDWLGKGKYVHVYGVPGALIRPVATVREFLVVRLSSAGSFLIQQDGLSSSVFQFCSVFRQCLFSAYSSHSFCIWAATKAARWGFDKSVIKQIGSLGI